MLFFETLNNMKTFLGLLCFSKHIYAVTFMGFRYLFSCLLLFIFKFNCRFSNCIFKVLIHGLFRFWSFFVSFLMCFQEKSLAALRLDLC